MALCDAGQKRPNFGPKAGGGYLAEGPLGRAMPPYPRTLIGASFLEPNPGGVRYTQRVGSG